jgi:hypothetical protein
MRWSTLREEINKEARLNGRASLFLALTAGAAVFSAMFAVLAVFAGCAILGACAFPGVGRRHSRDAQHAAKEQ